MMRSILAVLVLVLALSTPAWAAVAHVVHDWDGDIASSETHVYNSGLTSAGTGTDAVTSTAFTPTADGAYVWGATFAASFTGTVTKGTGFTDGNNTGTSPFSGQNGLFSEYLIQGAAASVASTFTQASANVNLINGDGVQARRRCRALHPLPDAAPGGGRWVPVSAFAWLPPAPWTCLRCCAIILTREAGPRCPRCGLREGT